MYWEHQLQRVDTYRGYLDRTDLTIEEMRAMLGELCDFFGLHSNWHFERPAAGLPGLLHADYNLEEEAADILLLGIEYAGARVRNERKTMHNRWREARETIRKIEKRAEERVVEEFVQRQVREALAAEAKPQLVYFIGSQSGPIKIGIAVDPTNRLKGLQTSHHEKLELLVTCPGGQERERAYHKQFAGHRLNGEWFARAPEIEAEIAKLRAVSHV